RTEGERALVRGEARARRPRPHGADGELGAAADEDALAACAGGCWLWEPAAARLRIRVVTTGAPVDVEVAGGS
ncbi:MAG TPA: hypothetical protein VHE35_00525, partial [Kofleriaceae bacterium]|nr:hypothetical protein [Kofleriaceae bacterium]